MNPEPFKLIAPFNLYPDGEPSSKVVGIGIGQYPEGGMAVFLIFESNRGQPVSVPMPEFESQVGADEFFFKEWVDGKSAAERLLAEGVVVITDKPAVSFGHGEVRVARINRSKLCAMTAAEREQYRS